ncbi:MAG: 2-C-methyl-D-erythritol 4-phosphate cytidylyltransferase [Clostridiales bacterium]|nr:2-C-methyl-D-erythritol 4-phosphate cytidylyltransferase [Clostridiales bacterium]
MKNIAIIIAGGSGKRTGQDIPKQFLTINDKPIIVYTLENFQRNEYVDDIIVVCIDGWEHVLEAYAKQFGITKLKYIVKGGESGQHSIMNGVEEAYKHYPPDSCVIIHDGIRPLVDASVLNDVIEVCHKHGNGVTSLPYNEQIFVIKDDKSTDKYIPRETLRRVSTPQAYMLGRLHDRYKEALAKGVGFTASSYVNTMMVDLGETLYFAKGSDKNIKLTTKDDLQIFIGYIQGEEKTWLK